MAVADTTLSLASCHLSVTCSHQTPHPDVKTQPRPPLNISPFWSRNAFAHLTAAWDMAVKSSIFPVSRLSWWHASFLDAICNTHGSQLSSFYCPGSILNGCKQWRCATQGDQCYLLHIAAPHCGQQVQMPQAQHHQQPIPSTGHGLSPLHSSQISVLGLCRRCLLTGSCKLAIACLSFFIGFLNVSKQ